MLQPVLEELGVYETRFRHHTNRRWRSSIEKFCLHLFRGKMNVGGTKFPEALIQQTTVMVCPRSPLTILLTDLFPLEVMIFAVFVGTVLTPVSSMLKMRCG
jgi:hypothetical protein